MNIQYIKYALAIKKFGSITRASKELFVSQPNMSSAIKKLEKDLNIKLFKRSSSGSVLTSTGIQFLNEIEPVIASLEDISKKYANVENNKSITIASLPSSMFESVVLDTMNKNNIKINLLQKSILEVVESVSSDLANIGFLYIPFELDSYICNILKSKSINYKDITKSTFYILTSVNSTLSSSNCDAISLMNYTCVFYEGLCDEYILDTSPVLRDFVFKIPNQKIFVSDRTSEYLTLSSLPNTISLSTKLPNSILDMYKLKQFPLNDYLVKYMYIYKSDKISNSIIDSISEDFISKVN